MTYSIGAVLDPATGELISPSMAVARGLLDMVRGVYVDPETGRAMTLAEAMEQGIISAEPLGGDENETLELSLRKAVSTTVRHGRSVFKISGVHDPSTGEVLHPDEAARRGLIDTSRGVYIDPLTGRTIPLHEAYEAGLLEAAEMDRKPEDVGGDFVATTSLDSASYSIVAVVNPLTGNRLSVSEAIRQNLLDENCRNFIDPRTGQRMPLQEAVGKGLVIVEGESSSVVGSPYRMGALIDERTGQPIPLIRSPAGGHQVPHDTSRLLDNLQSIVTSSTVGSQLPVDEAMQNGLMSGGLFTGGHGVSGDFISTIGTSQQKTTTNITGVRDPTTGKQVVIIFFCLAGLSPQNIT